MVDPRAQVSHKNKVMPNPQQIFAPDPYQQLLESLKFGGNLPDMQTHPMLQHPNQPIHPNMNTDEETIKIFKNYLKKYDVKRFFLKKILGDAYENEEGHEEGFFANKHLRRHGAAGMAGKVFGELIGIKIRKSIEGFGDTISDYAKEFTTNGFVSIGNKFNKLFRGA